MDKIIIKNLRIFAFHGVMDSEKQQGQTFEIDLVAMRDFTEFSHADNYIGATCYATLCDDVVEFTTKNRFDLIEALAENLAAFILKKHSALEALEIVVRKPSAPIQHAFDYVGVEIFRTRSDLENES